MFLAAFLLDFLIFRPIILLLLAFLRYFISLCQGYRKIPLEKDKEVKKLVNTAMSDMFYRNKMKTF